MEIVCTRPSCPRPHNQFADLDDRATLTTVQQKFCTACGMPLILSGRYLPEKLLGRGGFGAAFLARDRYTPTLRACVVKLFQPSGNLNPEQLQLAQSLFEREAAVLEKLGNQHPQLPDLYAFFPLRVSGLKPNIQEEYFYLVQEFIDGEDLEQILAQRGPLPATEVVEILVSMLKVLAFVHGNGTIHRDIKPSNIMRHRDGQLYLLDFGAVKQMTAQGKSSQRSTGIYSIGFAPPEQVASGAVYPATDLYALAVTCIVLLTGQDVHALYDSYHNTWAWRSQTRISPAIADILDRMLLPAPQQRYATADEVLEALRQVTAAGNATPASPAQPAAAVSPAPTAAKTPAPPSVAAQPAVAPSMGRGTSLNSVPLLEYLAGAAFTGVEGGLLAIAIASMLGTTWLGSGTWLLLLVGLVLLQARRVIERIDLVIIAAVTLLLVLLFPPLQAVITGPSPRVTVVVLVIMAGLATVAIATLFRLIYRVLSALM